MSDNKSCSECTDVGKQLQLLRRDLDQKHSQNRKDIHALRNQQQELLLRQVRVEGVLSPIVGEDGKPGILDELKNAVNKLSDAVNRLTILQAGDDRVKSAFKWLLGVVVLIVVPFLVVFVEHIWPAHK